MARSVRLLATAVLSVLCVTLVSAADWKDTLEHELEELYPKTQQARFEMNQVTKAGIVLVVQKDNIQGEPVHNFGSYASKVRDGEILGPGGAGGFFSRSNTQMLKPGDKVFVTGIAVKDDRVAITLLTCEMYDVVVKGSTKPTRLRSILEFELPRDALPRMDAQAVKHVIDAVLMIEAEAKAFSTKTVELGQSLAQVEAILGKPVRIAKVGERTIYVYQDIKVTFTNGVVTDVR